MTIKVSFTIDDAQLESDIDLARSDYNERADPAIDSNDEFAVKEARYALEQFRGKAKARLQVKIASLPDDAIAEVAALVDTKIPAKLVEVAVEAEPAAEVKK